MKLSDVLSTFDSDIRFEQFKLHLAVPTETDDPLTVFRSGGFDEWQSWQKNRNFERQYVLAIIKTPRPDEWLLAGIYERLGRTPASDNGHRYDLRPCAEFHELSGRALVRFKRPGRQSYLDADRWIDQMTIVEITREKLDMPAFPGYRAINLERPLLRAIVQASPDDWRISLSQVSGVYVVRDELTQQLYIGSATGLQGIWQRWSQYAFGDGGNKAFQTMFRAGGSERLDDLRFSLIETADFNATPKEIIGREEHWKRVLGTRLIGLN
jgi:hypothetical protein